MTYSLPTRFEEFTLKICVKTDSPQKIRIVVKDADKPNTNFTNRWKTVNGETDFYVRMPISGKSALIDVYNEKNGNRHKGEDPTFEVTEVKKIPLEKKLDVVDLSNPMIASFVNFAVKFCYNAGWLESGKYVSRDERFTIEYLPTIMSSRTGKALNTPARISQSTGRIQVSQEKFVPMTVPMRLAILFHEFSHYYINDDMKDEVEADLNGLLIYLGLGYPRIEAYEAFLSTFANVATQQNKERYDKINKFITDFENNNYIVYE